MPDSTTPMMRQYLSIKEKYPDCLLFFRLGDFYEMFLEDAEIGARELELTLTTRDRNKPEGERTAMCGVPYHSANTYIARLIAKGYKVAICEQMEDPALAKGIVERDIVRIVTPGTAIDATMLDESSNNFLCAACVVGESYALAFGDVSTGQCFATALPLSCGEEALLNEMSRYAPREVVASPALYLHSSLRQACLQRLDASCENGGEERFAPEKAIPLAEQQFSLCAEKLSPQEQGALQCAGALMSYLYETQKTQLGHMSQVQFYFSAQFMQLSQAARRNLELTQTLRTKEKRGSLLWVLDQTRTAMGHRLIRTWLQQPLLSVAEITRRLDAVEELVGDSIGRQELTLVLREITDLERLIGRVVYGSALSRDIVALGHGLEQLPRLGAGLGAYRAPLLAELRQQLQGLPQLCQRIFDTLQEDPPFSVREGEFIRDGFDQEVDRLRYLMGNSRTMLAGIESRERERTGIKNLKVSYNKVFGYYIEVSKANYDLVPEDYIRKQTLVNCERFITQELKDLEHDILSAKERDAQLEYQLFCQLREEIAQQVLPIQAAATAVGTLDVLLSFATVAEEQHYCRPQVDVSQNIVIRDGRHAVVEKMMRDALFVPNDTVLDGGENLVAVITGPNMAGKSTYMRQVALITLMAQVGSFVPAKSATVGIVDQIFTRIGASDDLSAGASTFMVEMNEVAELLKGATSRSLLILDEIGRGTSTYDGMAIARAVVEYCGEKLHCKTLFATHYHELTVLEREMAGVKNYNIAAKKKKDDIIFLRKIVPGGADQSYGIEVAQLAGVPTQVIRRSRALLEELQQGGIAPAPLPPREEEEQISLVDLGQEQVLSRLRDTTVETLTPIEAMNLLYELKRKLET